MGEMRKIASKGTCTINGIDFGEITDIYVEFEDDDKKKKLEEHDDKIDALSYTVID